VCTSVADHGRDEADSYQDAENLPDLDVEHLRSLSRFVLGF
jgi:hypothetical protein